MFELMYEPLDAGGAKVTETKRVTLDAGHHLNRFELAFTAGAAGRHAARRRDPEQPRLGLEGHRDAGMLRTWEPLKQEGHLGCAVIVPGMTEAREADGNYLAIAAARGAGRACTTPARRGIAAARSRRSRSGTLPARESRVESGARWALTTHPTAPYEFSSWSKSTLQPAHAIGFAPLTCPKPKWYYLMPLGGTEVAVGIMLRRPCMFCA